MSPRSEVLTSPSNRWLKEFRRALREAHPRPGALLGLEGPHLIEEALKSGLGVEALLVAPAGERNLTRLKNALAAQPLVKILRTSDRVFTTLSDTQHPQGIAALVRQPEHALADVLAGTSALVVVLVGVQDPGNVGTILRSAEAFSASGVIATGVGAHPYGPKALRASAGSALRVPVVVGATAAVVVAQLRMAKMRLFGATSGFGGAQHAVPLPELGTTGQSAHPVLSASCADLTGPVALLIGNEGAGLPEEVERSCDALVRIPIAAGVESLNAGVAASVILYEAGRQRSM